MTGGTPAVEVPTRTSQWTTPAPQAIANFAAPTAGVPVAMPGAGVQTGIPQGGHAAPAIAQYLAGTSANPALSYTPGQYDQWHQQVASDTATGVTDFEQQAQAFAEQTAAAQSSGTVTLPGGQVIHYDTPAEKEQANQIAQTIIDGGINPETGDYNISAGPNVLSAADEGLFGYGSDYNQEFQENYNANYEHAQNNPTGQTTGTPIYDQGYDNPFAPIVNNSLVGVVGNAITGENLVPTMDDLLPPAAAFNNDDNDSPSWQNDGDPTNDVGNAGWGFTSIADMFDGGGAGQSGDSYTGGIHGDATVGSTAQGPSSVVTDRNPSNDDGGSDSGGGGGGSDCVIATFARSQGVDLNRREAIQWCMSTLHDNWAGELVRLGYQTLGRKAIDAGKGREHFAEFKRYVDYARGQRKDIGAALTFYGRTSQFFIVGLWENYKCK